MVLIEDNNFFSIAVTSPIEASPVRARCFVPLNGIPDLRSQNAPNKALNQFRSRFQPEMSRSELIFILHCLRSFAIAY